MKQPADVPPHAAASAASARATAELQQALVHYQAGRREAALACCRTAIELCPDYAEAHNICAVMLIATGRRDESLAEFDEAIRLNPEYVEAHCNRGNALWAVDRLDDAEAAFRKALELQPNHVMSVNNLGTVLHERGRFQEAVECSRRAIALKPEFAEAHLNLATRLLLQGQFEEGWRQYEWRHRVAGFTRDPRRFDQPRWDGSPAPRPGISTLLLYKEQGYGDTIQWIRHVPGAIERGWRVVLECEPSMARWLQQSGGLGATIISRGPGGGPVPIPFDVQLPLASLPLTLGEIDPRQPVRPVGAYLTADADLRTSWRTRLASAGGKLKIGLVWAGSPGHGNDRNRSIALSRLGPLAQAPCIFVNLQMGPPGRQAATPPPGMRILNWTADIGDFADSAALVMELDLIITVDTAMAHMAGALGKPVWVLLPFVPDFRWMLDREDSPLYPSMRLFRQKTRGDWDEVIQRVRVALDAWAAAAPGDRK